MLTWYPREDDRPLRVAVLCSHRAPGLLKVLNDPRRGARFEIVACITSEHDLGEREELLARGVPTFVHDIHDFYRSWRARPGDLELRKHYDAWIAQRLSAYEPDVVILSSYLYAVTATLLEAYPQRVIRLYGDGEGDGHRERDGDARGSDAGPNPVRDAILAGARETRATAHLVVAGDEPGPTLVRSWAFPVHPLVEDLRRRNAPAALKAYAFAHQEWMVECTWAPLMLTVIELVACGELQAWAGEVLVSGSTRPLELEPAGRSLRLMRAMRSRL